MKTKQERVLTGGRRRGEGRRGGKGGKRGREERRK
jgi:hypothetical protein